MAVCQVLSTVVIVNSRKDLHTPVSIVIAAISSDEAEIQLSSWEQVRRGDGDLLRPEVLYIPRSLQDLYIAA